VNYLLEVVILHVDVTHGVSWARNMLFSNNR